MFRKNNVIITILFISLSLILLSCSSSYMVVRYPEVMPPPRVLQERPRVALVLGGGAFHGMAHLGVIKVLEEENIPIDLIVGTSAGSLTGVFYADNPNADSVLKIADKITLDAIFDASPYNSLNGFVTGEKLQGFIKNHIHSQNIEDTKIPFIAVATDLNSGKTIPISSGPIAPAINSSCAVPGIFIPVKMYGMLLVDGGVLDNVPCDIAKQYDPKVIIAVDIMADFNTNPEIENLTDVISRTYEIINRKMVQEQLKNADVVISPALSGYPLFSDKYNREMYEKGKTAAREKISEIKKVIAERITN